MKGLAEVPIYPGENEAFHPTVINSLIGQETKDGNTVVDAKWKSSQEIILVIEIDLGEEEQWKST